MDNQLEVIIKESGLEKTKAQFMLDNFQDYFAIAAEWETKSKNIVVVNADQITEMQMARVGRLFLQKKRTDIEKARKKLKEQIIIEGKAIDGIANVLKALIVPIEKYLEQQEKFVEIQEDRKRQALIAEADRKAEEERLENERLDKIALERRDMALMYGQFWATKEYAFREMSQTNFDSVMTDLRKAKADYEAEQKRIKDENDRLQKEAEEKEKALKIEREKAEVEHKRQEAKLKKQKEEAKRKQDKLEAKAKAEKAKQEAELIAEKELSEKKQKEADEKARKEKERIKKEAEGKIEAERKEKERLAELLKNQVTCPKCGHKFQPNEEK